MNDDDRSRARSLIRAARQAEIPLRPVHFADDQELLAFAPDDVAGAPDVRDQAYATGRLGSMPQ